MKPIITRERDDSTWNYDNHGGRKNEKKASIKVGKKKEQGDSP